MPVPNAAMQLVLLAVVKATPSPAHSPAARPEVHRGLLDTLASHVPVPWPPLWAFLLPLVVGIVLMPAAIGLLARAGMGQKIREEGPRSHAVKGGTPTSGGLAVVALVVLTVAIVDRSPRVVPALLAILLAGGFGLFDDLLTVRSRAWSRGLLARQRIVVQLAVGLLLAIVLFSAHLDTQLVPLLGPWRMGLIFIPVCAVTLAAAANAFNLTDGSDGLAPGVMLFIALVLALMLHNNHDQVALIRLLLATAGALCAFLAYNLPPARVFLGGVGSEGLGAMLATVAIAGGFLWFLPLLAVIPLVETLSVIAQVYWFKTTGKRILRMAPLHHHFQLGGWNEWTVALAAWAATCLAGTVSVLLARRPA